METVTDFIFLGSEITADGDYSHEIKRCLFLRRKAMTNLRFSSVALSCLTLWLYTWPPTRLLCPWDSPGKNTGVGCHFLLQCMKVKSESEVAQLCLTLSDPMDCSPPGSSIHGIFQARVWIGLPFPSPDMQMRPPLCKKEKRNSRASWWRWKRSMKKLA